MKKQWIVGLAILGAAEVWAEAVTNNFDVQGGFVYNHGAINPGEVGLTFTSAGVRDVTVSAGQLSGVDPETGAVITNAANLLPLKAQSLTAVSNIVAGGSFIGDGSQLINLNGNAFSGVISASSLPTSGVWNAAGVTITNAVLAGQSSMRSLTVISNLTVSNAVVAKQFRVANSTIGSYSESSAILAGSGNAMSNNVYNSAIVAGVNNAMSGKYSFIGAGWENKALQDYTVVGGGRYNHATNEYAFVGGGRGNHAYGLYSAIGGGQENEVKEPYTSVGGGYRNGVYGEKGSIAGGGDNQINAPYGAIGGGRNNRISGTNAYAGILGGVNNTAAGYAATVGGGEENVASGSYSWAAGRCARAIHEGAFVWSDSGTNLFQSVTSNEFAVYARGGLRLVGGRFIGDGGGLTNLAAGIVQESDPVWGSSSNLYYSKDAADARFVSLTEYSAYTNAVESRLGGALIAQTNLTVQGAFTALYVPPQGDLLMGRFTNGVPQ